MSAALLVAAGRAGSRSLDRADRRAAADGQAAARRRRRAPTPLSARRRPGRRDGDHDHRHRAEDRRRARVGGFTVGGMAKGAGMLAPGLATMLVVLTTDAVADGAHAGRGAARSDPGQLRPAGLRRRDVHQRHRAAAGLRRVRRRAEPRSSSTAAVTRACTDLAEQLLADAEGATKEIAIEVRARGHRGRRRRGRPRRRPQQPGEDRVLRPGRRTGAASSPRSAPSGRTWRSTPTRSTSPSTGCWICRAGATGDDRDAGRPHRPAVHVRHRPARRHRDRDHPDQRPVPRLRARELGVLDMTAPIRAAMNGQPGEPRRAAASRARAGSAPGTRAEVLADALPWLRRFAGSIVVVKYGGNAMTDDTLQAGVRRRHGVPAHRRAAPGRGARRRPADQRHAETARPARRIQGRLPGHHPGDDGHRPDGAGRSGRPGTGRADQRARPAGGRHVRRGRGAVHRGPPAPCRSTASPTDIGLVGDVVDVNPAPSST